MEGGSNMSNKYVYYGGTFAGKNLKQLGEYRKKNVQRFKSHSFIVRNPLRGNDLDICADRVASTGVFEPNELVHRDLSDIRNSDIVVLEFTGLNSIGSACEMTYSYLNQIPVLIVCEDERVQVHPWTRSMAAKIYPTMEDMFGELDKWIIM